MIIIWRKLLPGTLVADVAMSKRIKKKQKNTEMSDKEHSDSEFYHPEEQEIVDMVDILTKLKQAEIADPDMKS